MSSRKYAGAVGAAVLLVMLSGGCALAQSAGEKSFAECAACHSLKADEHDIGPSLKGVLGRKAGTSEGFRYSTAMQRSDIVWSRETLDQFIADPQKLVRGTRMPFSGFSDPGERAALLDYLEKALK